MHPGGVVLGPVMRHIVIDMFQRPLHAPQLQRLQFIPAGLLDGLQHRARHVLLAQLLPLYALVSSVATDTGQADAATDRTLVWLTNQLFDEGQILDDL
jgi:hypothetical protein